MVKHCRFSLVWFLFCLLQICIGLFCTIFVKFSTSMARHRGVMCVCVCAVFALNGIAFHATIHYDRSTFKWFFPMSERVSVHRSVRFAPIAYKSSGYLFPVCQSSVVTNREKPNQSGMKLNRIWMEWFAMCVCNVWRVTRMRWCIDLFGMANRGDFHEATGSIWEECIDVCVCVCGSDHDQQIDKECEREWNRAAIEFWTWFDRPNGRSAMVQLNHIHCDFLISIGNMSCILIWGNTNTMMSSNTLT